jgi:hypothetical protein
MGFRPAESVATSMAGFAAMAGFRPQPPGTPNRNPRRLQVTGSRFVPDLVSLARCTAATSQAGPGQSLAVSFLRSRYCSH